MNATLLGPRARCAVGMMRVVLVERTVAVAKMKLPPIVRDRMAPAYRRARREWQWRTCGADLRLATGPAMDFPYVVATHRSVLLRRLAGVDMQLQRNKVTNLLLAAVRLDGLVLEPGQRLSFWRHVGNPTAERGFLEGVVLNDGTLESGVGGGLCQMTNLIHWMTIHTDLTVVERWRHGYDVFPDVGRSVPFASGATCAYPSLDLQIENRTQSRWRLGLTVEPKDLAGEWRVDQEPRHTYRPYEATHVITNDGPGVYMRRNIIRRKVIDINGVVVDDELVNQNHARMMYDPVLGAAPVRLPIA